MFDYTGPREAKDVVDFALAHATKLAKARLAGKEENHKKSEAPPIRMKKRMKKKNLRELDTSPLSHLYHIRA